MNALVSVVLIWSQVMLNINGDLWYRHVDCFDTPNGLICYDKNQKSVLTPFGNQQNGYAHISPLGTNNAASNQYTQQMHPSTSTPFARSRDPSELSCSDNEFKCTSLHQCIDKGKHCDGHVNCVDGTDEEDCTCISKLDRKKICDNYFDCPLGDDEAECHNCGPDSYSCYSDVPNECYSKTQKCDFFSHCSNGEDEKDCLLLTPHTASPINPFVRSTEGFLYANFKNNWYPVCTDHLNHFARTVCERELGVQLSDDETISITHEPRIYDGQYLSKVDRFRSQFLDQCLENDMESTNYFVYVKCPDRCGSITESTIRARIAGGKDASVESHPWMAGLYLNGTFVCSGSIIRRRTIITAAHCVYHKRGRLTKYDHLQVRVGFVRQRSFSPHEQIINVERVVIHPDYRRKGYQNDIAVLQLSDRMIFNRWVKKICLQTKKLIGDGNDPNWMWKPAENTICSTAGWGGFTDRGPLPVENLVELKLPILPNCVVDNANVTCAGYPNGGSDTCTGDSGGPLECRSDPNRNEFYLAGITSAGYNPKKLDNDEIFCGEPDSVTAFTKPAFYLDWIRKARHEEDVNDIWPTQLCPGVLCRTNNRCVKAYDGIVDCMYGEDEIKKF